MASENVLDLINGAGILSSDSLPDQSDSLILNVDRTRENDLLHPVKRNSAT